MPSLQLDILTVMVLMASGHLLLALLLALHRVEDSLQVTVRIWQAAQLLKAIGIAGIIFAVILDHIPLRLLANILVFAGFACELMAYRRYTLQRTLPSLPLALLAIGSITFLSSLWVPEAWHTQFTVTTASILLALFTLFNCLTLNRHRKQQSSPLPMLKVLLWTNGLNSTVFVFRGLSAALIDQHAVATQAPINEAAFLFNFLLMLVNGMGFMLLIKEEVDSKLRELVIRDPLTGLYNRRHVDSRLEMAISEHTERQQSLSISLLDLDNFKAVNDTYGHAAGDYILREFAAHLREHLRPADLIARVGGEEFFIMMQDTKADSAHSRVQAILDAFMQRQFRLGKDQVNLSFSAGIAELTKPTRPSDLMRQADQALYSSKDNGRMQVSRYQSSAEEPVHSQAHYPSTE